MLTAEFSSPPAYAETASAGRPAPSPFMERGIYLGLGGGELVKAMIFCKA